MRRDSHAGLSMFGGRGVLLPLGFDTNPEDLGLDFPRNLIGIRKADAKAASEFNAQSFWELFPTWNIEARQQLLLTLGFRDYLKVCAMAYREKS